MLGDLESDPAGGAAGDQGRRWHGRCGQGGPRRLGRSWLTSGPTRSGSPPRRASAPRRPARCCRGIAPAGGTAVRFDEAGRGRRSSRGRRGPVIAGGGQHRHEPTLVVVVVVRVRAGRQLGGRGVRTRIRRCRRGRRRSGLPCRRQGRSRRSLRPVCSPCLPSTRVCGGRPSWVRSPSPTLRTSDQSHVPIRGSRTRPRRWQHPPGHRRDRGP